MTDLRTAAQQALEALERYQVKRQDFDRFADEITALRAALAQEQAEPVAWLYEAGADRTLHWYKPPLCGTPLYTAPPQRQPLTIDEAMQQPRAMAQAYERGYNAGAAAERERIIQFLTEMQRVVGDAHNHYGVAAVRIKERV